MIAENTIQEIYNLKSHKEILESQINKLKDQLANICKIIDEKEAILLAELSNANITELEVDDLVGFTTSKKSIGYTSEADIINLLKSSYDGNYIKTKVTESLDKNALKKAMKSNDTLNADISPFIINGVTQYVVVTTKENRARMLDHINSAANE